MSRKTIYVTKPKDKKDKKVLRPLSPQEIMRNTLIEQRRIDNARIRGRLMHFINEGLFSPNKTGNHDHLRDIAEILSRDLNLKVTRSKVQKQAAILKREIELQRQRKEKLEMERNVAKS